MITNENDLSNLEKCKKDLLRICSCCCKECPFEYEQICLIRTIINSYIYEAQKE